MLKNKHISLEEKFDILDIYSSDNDIYQDKKLLNKIRYLKDKNKLDLINSCPEKLLLCVLSGDTLPLINYFNKDNLPKINGVIKNLEIVEKYYELKNLSFFIKILVLDY